MKILILILIGLAAAGCRTQRVETGTVDAEAERAVGLSAEVAQTDTQAWQNWLRLWAERVTLSLRADSISTGEGTTIYGAEMTAEVETPQVEAVGSGSSAGTTAAHIEATDSVGSRLQASSSASSEHTAIATPAGGWWWLWAAGGIVIIILIKYKPWK